MKYIEDMIGDNLNNGLKIHWIKQLKRFNNPKDKQSEIRIINGNNEGNRLLIIILITLLERETI